MGRRVVSTIEAPGNDGTDYIRAEVSIDSPLLDKKLDVNEVYDLFAFRIVVPTEADCYAVLGIIHHAYSPQVSRFKDYIARPKENGDC